MKPKANLSTETSTGRRARAARSKTIEAREGSVSSPPAARTDTTPDPGVPSSYPRRILLSVTGLSPQVVTETLYALALNASPPFLPTEIHLITTREGAERARLALLSDDPGWFHRLLKDYGLPPIAFDPTNIHVLDDEAGGALDDIRTPGDNERTADFITEAVREFTADAHSAVHTSIAGGRKTMGFYLGYALSLFGREQDRLSHVLVSEPFESSWDFFYPTTNTRVITTRDNKLADTRNAKVTLAEIPFVSLRHGLPDKLLEGRTSFSETVAAARQTLGPPELVIDLRGHRIRAGGVVLSLPPAELAFLSWFARRRIDAKPDLACPSQRVPERQYAEEFLSEYRRIIGPMGDDDRTTGRLSAGMDKQFFLERKSRLHHRIRTELGKSAARSYLVTGRGTRPQRFGIALDRNAISFDQIVAA
ncbi:MAG: CRISPR-associated ring nuclease Csm6 [Chromatiales bacterium]